MKLIRRLSRFQSVLYVELKAFPRKVWYKVWTAFENPCYPLSTATYNLRRFCWDIWTNEFIMEENCAFVTSWIYIVMTHISFTAKFQHC